MELVQGVNFARIEWCCQKVGITTDPFLTELGISTAAIESAKAGEPSFTFVELKKIAEHFGHGVLFFVETAHNEEQATYTLVANEVLYYSQGDEDEFFAWLNS